MNRNEIIPFLMGLFVGFILLSMYYSTFTIAEYLSSIIAGCAIILTMKTIQNTKKHNTLSVQPKLSVNRYTTKNKIEYKLSNKGVGTAHCKNIQFFHQGNAVDFQQYEDKLIQLLSKYNCEMDESEITHFSSEMFISQGETLTILTVVSTTEIRQSLWSEYVKNFEVKIDYECIYGTADSLIF